MLQRGSQHGVTPLRRLCAMKRKLLLSWVWVTSRFHLFYIFTSFIFIKGKKKQKKTSTKSRGNARYFAWCQLLLLPFIPQLLLQIFGLITMAATMILLPLECILTTSDYSGIFKTSWFMKIVFFSVLSLRRTGSFFKCYIPHMFQ